MVLNKINTCFKTLRHDGKKISTDLRRSRCAYVEKQVLILSFVAENGFEARTLVLSNRSNDFWIARTSYLKETDIILPEMVLFG